MQAIILAAGMGKRLKELTRNNTKCMVEVNGVTLIDRVLRQLDALSLNRIVVVVGYEGHKLQQYIGTLSVDTPIQFVENPIYDKTNNIYSLWLAREELAKDDTLLLESDLIFEDSVLRALVDDPRDTLALVDKYERWMDGTVVKLDDEDRILAFVPGKQFDFREVSQYYKTVNLYKFSKHFSNSHYIPFLDAYSKALGNNEYYEQVLRVIAMLDDPCIRAKRLEGQKWYEIDDVQDLDIASSMFAPEPEQRLKALQGRFGGYWRYPKLLDFCYLVNPYYPPKKLMEELKSNFEVLLTQYPSGMRVNALLAGKNFGLHPEHIVVGNGAAELIRYMKQLEEGKVGIIRPTFEEYPHCCDPDNMEVFAVPAPDYRYTEEDLMAYFEDKPVSRLVLINPDNPSGNYIPKAGVLRLCAWCAQRNIQLVVDESFVDFAEEEDATLLQEELLQANPNLVVIKSISKSYGVPGLRLGVLASADEALISQVKKSVPIWNINSFAEYYMQIEEKYKKDYTAAMARFREARSRFAQELSALPGLRVLPSQANYFMCELTGGVTATALTTALLQDNIFIKDLTSKVKEGTQFIRIAVRTEEENHALVEAMRKYLS